MTAAVTVTVASAEGSTPREVGAAMTVFADRLDGTIGGGALEWEAIGIARAMLRDGRDRARRRFPLGPSLGQCCGGSVTLDFTAGLAEPAPRTRPVWVWGAGHVGRAVVSVLNPLPEIAVTWVDTDASRFPDVPGSVTPVVAAEPAPLARHAPGDAHHLIMTYSHDLDLAICDALLRSGFGSAGLIGSRTKWARFRRRLAAMGHDTAAIARIACPIGDPSLGKHPQAIAVGVAAALLSRGDGKSAARDACA